jgi:hypothetical protein
VWQPTWVAERCSPARWSDTVREAAARSSPPHPRRSAGSSECRSAFTRRTEGGAACPSPSPSRSATSSSGAPSRSGWRRQSGVHRRAGVAPERFEARHASFRLRSYRKARRFGQQSRPDRSALPCRSPVLPPLIGKPGAPCEQAMESNAAVASSTLPSGGEVWSTWFEQRPCEQERTPSPPRDTVIPRDRDPSPSRPIRAGGTGRPIRPPGR